MILPRMILPFHPFAVLASFRCKIFFLFNIVAVALLAFFNTQAAPLPTLDQAIASKDDLWGDAAMRQPNGASYEFFEPLLPPLRYVNADFHYYPIVLGAPN